MDQGLSQEDVRRCLDGDEAALRRLVADLTPVIQARVTRILLRVAGRAPGRSVRQEIEDLTQETFLTLFADGARVLAGWQPERGLSLRNFVGLVAERQALSILRSGKRSPWKEDPTLNEDLDGMDPVADPETVAASRQTLRRLLGRVHEELSPLGRHLFDLLFVQDLEVSEVVRRTAMSPDAIYAWRSRLRTLARRSWARLSEVDGGDPVDNSGGHRVRKPTPTSKARVGEP